jgi:lysophospholipase L1-like esterase
MVSSSVKVCLAVLVLGAVFWLFFVASVPTPPKVEKIILLGDSIFKGWPVQRVGGAVIDNMGVSGQVTGEILDRLEQKKTLGADTLVVIMGGTNDIAGNRGPYRKEQTVRNIEKMVRFAQERGARVCLCTVLPVKRYPWSPKVKAMEQIEALNAEIRHVPADLVLDWFPAFQEREEELYYDGVHPNDAGYKVMLSELSRKLPKIKS